jgi:hypothetical protein
MKHWEQTMIAQANIALMKARAQRERISNWQMIQSMIPSAIINIASSIILWFTHLGPHMVWSVFGVPTQRCHRNLGP